MRERRSDGGRIGPSLALGVRNVSFELEAKRISRRAGTRTSDPEREENLRGSRSASAAEEGAGRAEEDHHVQLNPSYLLRSQDYLLVC